jgi:hypothetical protein
MKHLVFLIDGTWLAPTDIGGRSRYSNVHRMNLFLADSLAKDRNPLFISYTRGIGAVSGFQRYAGGGIAKGIEEMIEDVYINISSNYETEKKDKDGNKIEDGDTAVRLSIEYGVFGVLNPTKVVGVSAVAIANLGVTLLKATRPRLGRQGRWENLCNRHCTNSYYFSGI